MGFQNAIENELNGLEIWSVGFEKVMEIFLKEFVRTLCKGPLYFNRK